MIRWWGYTLNLRTRQELSSDYCRIKLALYVLSLLEVWSNRDNASASVHWPLPWVSIEEVRRSVELEDVVVICVLLIVQSYLNDGLSQDIWRWRKAVDLCWINYYCRDFANVFKHTKGVIVVRNHWIITERMEISTLKKNLSATSVWASVRYQFCYSWLWIVPVE